MLMMLPISELGVTETGEFEFDAASNQLEIKFLSLGFRPGEVLRYQFMLEGADSDEWAVINATLLWLFKSNYGQPCHHRSDR